MKIRIDPALFQAFPGYVRHVVLAEGLDNSGGPEQHPRERLFSAEIFF